MAQMFDHPRLNDWTIRYTEFLKESIEIARELCIDWDSEGVTCFSWVGDGIEAITGHNPHDPHRGQYSGLVGTCRYLKKLGYSSFNDFIADRFKEIPVGMAQAGDIVLVNNSGWTNEHPDEALVAEEMMPCAVALCDPPFYFGVTEHGLVRGDLYTQGVRAFAVGRSV